MHKLFIISNESVYEEDGTYYCDNIDIKSTPEGLDKNFQVNLLARKSKIKRSHKINIKKIKIFSSIFFFLKEVINSLKINNTKYIIISLSPYTFVSCLILKLFGKKPFIYLRSNGFDEYKIILGSLGYIIYYLMFNISTNIATNIACRRYILRNKKGFVIQPSQLNDKWFENQKDPGHIGKKLLYVGRIRKEKGVFSLIEMIKDKSNIELTIVGEEEKKKIKEIYKNINFLKLVNDQTKLIKIYDEHKIFILPSFTEGEPMALLESLSRLKPVIIFQEIEHVIQKRAGIFISKRNYDSLDQTINHILKNYESIKEMMKKNELPTNSKFIRDLSKIILDN